MDQDDLSSRWAPTLHAVSQVETQRHSEAEEATLDEDLPFQSQNEAWEEAVKIASAEGPHTGVMVAFFPTTEQQQEMAVEGGEPPEDLHLTLAYLGELGAELVAEDEAKIITAVQNWAAGQEPMSAITAGHGIFTGGPSPVTYASIDAPALPSARQALIEALDKAGVPSVQDHGYTPHMTLAYDERRDVVVPQMSMHFDTVTVEFAGNKSVIPLGRDHFVDQVIPARAADLQRGGSISSSTLKAGQVVGVGGYPIIVQSEHPYRFGSSRSTIEVSERPSKMETVPTLKPPLEPDTARAFVTDVGGRTLITGPATTIAAMKDPTVEDITAAHMLWMHGRFVGADVPNRNGALWSAGDLEMAKGSVVNGPLNWLHDARHVIGTLAKADYVDPGKQMSGRSGQGVQAAGAQQAHITATAAIWKWIYPDEAYVVQQASEQEMLWYSMECISKEVSCVGDSGCGNTTSYSDYMSGAACDHVRQRASVRRFVNPVFLGGAVIVPPTRPGWAEADARVMSTANSLAEAAFEQAGRPDMSASAWEQLMGQLVRFAEN